MTKPTVQEVLNLVIKECEPVEALTLLTFALITTVMATGINKQQFMDKMDEQWDAIEDFYVMNEGSH